MLIVQSQCLILKIGSFVYNPNTAIPESSSIVCENSLMQLNCEQKNGIIRISRANYGRFSLGQCTQLGATNEWNVRCRQPDSKRIVAERYRKDSLVYSIYCQSSLI